MRRVNVMLDEDTVEKAGDIGSGNLSAGLRIAVSAFPQKAVTKPKKTAKS